MRGSVDGQVDIGPSAGHEAFGPAKGQDLTSAVTLFQPGSLRKVARGLVQNGQPTACSLPSARRWANGDIAPSLTESVHDAILDGERVGG